MIGPCFVINVLNTKTAERSQLRVAPKPGSNPSTATIVVGSGVGCDVQLVGNVRATHVTVKRIVQRTMLTCEPGASVVIGERTIAHQEPLHIAERVFQVGDFKLQVKYE